MENGNTHQRNNGNVDNRRWPQKFNDYIYKKFDELDLFEFLTVWAFCVLLLMVFVVFLVYMFFIAQSSLYNLVMGTPEALLEKEDIL